MSLACFKKNLSLSTDISPVAVHFTFEGFKFLGAVSTVNANGTSA